MKQIQRSLVKRNASTKINNINTKLIGVDKQSDKFPIGGKTITQVWADELLNYWNEQGLQQHRKPNTAIYKKSLKSLQQLLEGSHPQFNKKFKKHEIQESIDNFVRVVIDPNLKPINKAPLRKKSLDSFIYNSFGNTKSLLTHFLTYEPEPVLSYKERHPGLTRALMIVWNREMKHGIKEPYTPDEKNLFRKAANRIMKIIEGNKEKLQWLMLSGGPIDIAEAMWRCIEETTNYNLSRVNIHWLSSDITISRFTTYLAQKGYVKPQNEWS